MPHWKRTNHQITRGLVRLQTGLPDFLPRKAKVKIVGDKGSKQYRESVDNYNNGIFITLLSDRSVPDLGKRHFSRLKNNYAMLDSGVEGLNYFKRRGCGEDRCSSFDFYFHRSEDENQWIRFRCLLERYLSGCTAMIAHNDWIVEYTIRRSQLYRWEEFDSGVRSFVDSIFLGTKHQ